MCCVYYSKVLLHVKILFRYTVAYVSSLAPNPLFITSTNIAGALASPNNKTAYSKCLYFVLAAIIKIDLDFIQI